MKLIEYSNLLGYVVAFDSETKCYFIYSPTMNETTYNVAKTLTTYDPTALIVYVTDEERAKRLLPECVNVIDEINGNIAD